MNAKIINPKPLKCEYRTADGVRVFILRRENGLSPHIRTQHENRKREVVK